MPRIKGTKNKKKRTVRLKLPPSTLAILTKLSEDACLPFLKVLDDAVLEGAAELRSEVYDKYIDFNLRLRGKITHERELKPVSQTETEAGETAGLTGGDQTGSGDADVGPGLETAPDANLEMGAGSREEHDEFRRRALETAEHIANHPPFFNTDQFSIPPQVTTTPENSVG